MFHHRLTFRPIQPQDEAFLRDLYASTRTEELAQLKWSDEQKSAFLSMQFEAQHRFYMDTFKAASFDIVLREGKPIGRLYVDRRPTEIRLIDIAISPAFRNQGIGGRLLRDLLAEGGQTGRKVTIHVERFNPALNLYRRLGFREVDDSGVYYLMEWSPNPRS